MHIRWITVIPGQFGNGFGIPFPLPGIKLLEEDEEVMRKIGGKP